MALVTLQGTVEDVQGGFYGSGIILFDLDAFFITPDCSVIPKGTQTASLNPTDGTFSTSLTPTLDGIPNTRRYSVSININDVVRPLGTIQLPSSPPTQDIADLL